MEPVPLCGERSTFTTAGGPARIGVHPGNGFVEVLDRASIITGMLEEPHPVRVHLGDGRSGTDVQHGLPDHPFRLFGPFGLHGG